MATENQETILREWMTRARDAEAKLKELARTSTMPGRDALLEEYRADLERAEKALRKAVNEGLAAKAQVEALRAELAEERGKTDGHHAYCQSRIADAQKACANWKAQVEVLKELLDAVNRAGWDWKKRGTRWSKDFDSRASDGAAATDSEPETTNSQAGLSPRSPGCSDAPARPSPHIDPMDLERENIAIWTCEIGPARRCDLPEGADGPLRAAVEAAFVKVTGHEPYRCYSGWGAREFSAPSPSPDVVREALERARNWIEDSAEGGTGKPLVLERLRAALAHLDAQKEDRDANQ